jgi:hypothetical protein
MGARAACLLIRSAVIATVAVLLCSCGAVEIFNYMNADHNRDNMVKSEAAYKGCLAEHPNNAAACESLRLAYQADVQAYAARTGANVNSGTQQ